MHITNYQMHNVLKVYTNHLSKVRSHKSDHPTIRKPNSDMVRISAEGKRQNIIDKVAADIVARITKEGIDSSASPNTTTAIKRDNSGKHSSFQNKNAQFEYNVMRGNAEKEINRLSVGNAGFLIRRIEELTTGPDSDGAELTSISFDDDRVNSASE